MENKTNTQAVAAADAPAPPNPPTVDAQEKIARLRAIEADFPNESDPKPLTKAELRLATVTAMAFLEKAALFAEAAPDVGGALAVDCAVLRDAIAYELAYGGVVDETQALARRVQMAIARKKLKAVKVARALYRVAKGYVTSDAGDLVKTHVREMGRALNRHRTGRKASSRQPPASADSGGAGAAETNK